MFFKGLDIGALDVKRAFAEWFWSSTIYTKLWNYVIAPKLPKNSIPGHKNNQAQGSRGGEQREGSSQASFPNTSSLLIPGLRYVARTPCRVSETPEV